MRITGRRIFAVALSLSVLVAIVVLTAHGQGRLRGQNKAAPRGGAGDKSKSLRIRQIEGNGPSGMARAPQYEVRNVNKSSNRQREWGRILCVYDTGGDDWIQQLDFRYYVLLLSRDKANKDAPYTMLEGNVSYVEIKKGDNHRSTMFIHPNTIDRYGDIVACTVEISMGDEKVFKTDIGGRAKVKGKWWEGLRGEKGVTVKSDYLLTRSQTPYSFVNYDDYEQILR